MNKELEFLISPGLWRKSHKFAAAIIIVMLIFYGGFMTGSYVTIKAVVKVAMHFIDIDETMINDAIYRYNWKIKSCYPLTQNDTPINRNSGE